MNEKAVSVLELPKILERLASYTSFSAGADLCRELRPTDDIRLALEWQQETAEAVALFEAKTDISMGGARDVRDAVGMAQRGIILEPTTLLDIRSTLRRATTLKRLLVRLRPQFPTLGAIAERLEDCVACKARSPVPLTITPTSTTLPLPSWPSSAAICESQPSACKRAYPA